MVRIPFTTRRAAGTAARTPPPINPAIDRYRYEQRSSAQAAFLWGGGAEREGVPAPYLDGENSNVILAISNWRARFLMRTKIMLWNEMDGSYLADHPALDIIRQPNASDSGGNFWHRVVLDYDTNGNVFLYKIRPAPDSMPIGLQRIDPRYVTVERIGGVLRYKVNRTGDYLRAEDVIHWKHIPDTYGLIGYSPVAALWSELAADTEAATAYWHILRNAGVVGLVAIMDEDKAQQLGPAERKKFFRDLMRQFTGRNRGRPGIAGGGGLKDIKEVTGVAGKIDFSHIFNRIEERTCADYGIPPQVIGFGAGAETPQWGTTVASLRMEAVTNSGEPMVADLLDALNCFFVPDFGMPGYRFAAEFGGVPEIAQMREETLDRAIQRGISLVQAGVYTAEEFKAALEGADAAPRALALPEAKG